MELNDFLNYYDVLPSGEIYAKDRIVHTKTGDRRYKRRKLKLEETKNGYLRVVFSDASVSKRFLVHRVVASVYIPNPENLREVNHIDGNKKNNCVDNLEWVSSSDNQKHAYRIGLQTSEYTQKANSIAVDMFSKDGRYLKMFPSLTEGAKETGMTVANIAFQCRYHSFPRKYKFYFRYHNTDKVKRLSSME